MKILHIHLCSIIIITYVMNSFLTKVITPEDLCAVSGKSCLPMNVALRGQKLKTKSTSQKPQV